MVVIRRLQTYLIPLVLPIWHLSTRPNVQANCPMASSMDDQQNRGNIVTSKKYTSTHQRSVVSSTCVYCVEYQNSSAQVKESILFDKIVATEYNPKKLPPWLTACQSRALFPKFDFNNIFDIFSDERPPNFKRFFHENGIVAKVQFQSTGANNFTGLFRGADYGLLRFSPLSPLLAEPYVTKYFLGTVLLSFGLKLFRDNIHSGNILTGDSFKGLNKFKASRSFYDKPDFNIFSRPVDNMASITDENDLLFGKFEALSGVLSLADFSAYDRYGNEEATPKTPFIVQFYPNPSLKQKFGLGPSLDFRKWAVAEGAIPIGTVLYTAWTTVYTGTGEPSLCLDANKIPQVDIDVTTLCPDQEVVKLGDVVMKSRFYASLYSDKSLLFQHTRACPKDQSICVSGSTPVDSSMLTIPTTFYAKDDSDICVSDETYKDGILRNINPNCPAGFMLNSTSLTSCYPGVLHQVPKTQTMQCPYILMMNKSLIGVADNFKPEERSCSYLSQLFSRYVLTGVLFLVSRTIRLFRGLFGLFGV
jgi:hypothetical protein